MMDLFIRRAGQPVIGFGVNAPPPAPTDPYAAASVQLSQLLAQAYAAKKLIEKQQYPQAISALQVVGNLAASGLGPKIDQGPYPNITQPFTQDAWTINGQLASIAGPDVASANQAAAIIDQMMADYSTAINKAHEAMGIAPRTEPSPSWPYVLFAGAVLAAGGTAAYLTWGR